MYSMGYGSDGPIIDGHVSSLIITVPEHVRITVSGGSNRRSSGLRRRRIYQQFAGL